MKRSIHKSKIHRATITDVNLEGRESLIIDQDLMEAADILPKEQVQIVNNNNGERLKTYAIPGKRSSGIICINGGAARKNYLGDIIIIIAYALADEEEAKILEPKVILVDENNVIANNNF